MGGSTFRETIMAELGATSRVKNGRAGGEKIANKAIVYALKTPAQVRDSPA
jgi:hypothetical protein